MALRRLPLLSMRLLYLNQHLAPTWTSKGQEWAIPSCFSIRCGKLCPLSSYFLHRCPSKKKKKKKIKFTWNPQLLVLEKLLSAPCLITEKGDDPTERLWFVWEREIWTNFALELCWLIYWTSKRGKGREEVEEGNLSRGLDWKCSGGTLVPVIVCNLLLGCMWP